MKLAADGNTVPSHLAQEKLDIKSDLGHRNEPGTAGSGTIKPHNLGS